MYIQRDDSAQILISISQEKMEALALESLYPDVKKNYDLVRSVGEECVTDSELRNLVAKKPGFILYDGFEPSGRMHIAQVLNCAFLLSVARQRSRFCRAYSRP